MPPDMERKKSLKAIPEKNPGYLWVLLSGFVALIAGVILFYNLAGHRTFGSHEVYAVVPARTMLQTGDWLVPRIGGEPRLRKPPLAYWAVASSAILFGRLDEWTARFPAAVAALALTALMGLWARRWYGRTAGIIAALVQCTSVYVIIFARKAEVDMLLCLCTTAALYLIATHRENSARYLNFWRWTFIYALLAVTWLAKFYFGVAMVLGPTIIFFLVQKRYRHLWNLANPVGLLLLIAAATIWPYLLLKSVPGVWEVWKTETIGRAVGELGAKPIWYFLPYIAWLTLPWTGAVIAAVPSGWRLAWQKRDPCERFLWIWFFTDLAIMTVSADKHSNYLNAVLPALSLAAGRYLAEIIDRWQREPFIIGRLRRWLFFLFSVTIPIGLTLFLTQKYPYITNPIIAIGVIMGCFAVFGLLFITQKRLIAAGTVALLGFIGCFIVVMGWVMPARDHRVPAKNFAQLVRKEHVNREIVAFRMDMTAVEYYLEEPVRRIESLDILQKDVQRKGRLLVVAFASLVNKFQPFAVVTQHRRMVNIDGFASAKHPPLVLVELTPHFPNPDKPEKTNYKSQIPNNIQ